MFYNIIDKTIVFESENLNLYQIINPITGENFKNKSEQIDWIESTLKEYFNTTKLTVSFADEDGNPLTSLYVDTAFVLKVESEILEPFAIKAKLFVDDSDFDQDVDLNFANGVATADLNLSKSQKYYIRFDQDIAFDHEGNAITLKPVHELHEYLIFIGDNQPV